MKTLDNFYLYIYLPTCRKLSQAYIYREKQENAVKCLSQGHNRMLRIGFELRPCRSQSRRFQLLHHAANLKVIPYDKSF